MCVCVSLLSLHTQTSLSPRVSLSLLISTVHKRTHRSRGQAGGRGRFFQEKGRFGVKGRFFQRRAVSKTRREAGEKILVKPENIAEVQADEGAAGEL